MHKNTIKFLALLLVGGLVYYYFFVAVEGQKDEVRRVARQYCQLIGQYHFREAADLYEPGAFADQLFPPDAVLETAIGAGIHRYASARIRSVTVIGGRAMASLVPEGQPNEAGHWELTFRKINGQWRLARESMSNMSLDNSRVAGKH